MANPYYENTTNKIIDGTNAKASDVENKCDDIVVGFDGVDAALATLDDAITLSNADNTVFDIPDAAASRADKTVGFDSLGDLTLATPIAGPKGDTGDTGAKGDTGTAATVDAGTTTTGAEGTSASVVNSGSTSAAIFDFTIPVGDTGATGDKGDTGDQGIQGIQGIQGVQGIQGDQGIKGDTGDAGADGVVQTVVGGTNVTVDSSDPANPIVNASGGAPEFTVKTANYTAVVGDLIAGDTSAVGAFTVTLPLSPTEGDMVTVRAIGGDVVAENLTVGRNGHNITGLAEDFIFNIDNFEVAFVYYNVARGWEY